MNLVKLMLDKKNNELYLEVTGHPLKNPKYFKLEGWASEPDGKLIDISLNSMFVELGGEDDKQFI